MRFPLPLATSRFSCTYVAKAARSREQGWSEVVLRVWGRHLSVSLHTAATRRCGRAMQEGDGELPAVTCLSPSFTTALLGSDPAHTEWGARRGSAPSPASQKDPLPARRGAPWGTTETGGVKAQGKKSLSW